MSKELEKDFMNSIMDKIELKVEPTDIAKLLYDIYDVPSGICEQIKDMVQRLEAIEKGECTDIIYNVMAFKNDNANPSEALRCFKEIEERCKNDYEDCIVWYDYKKELYTVKQALIKAQELENENNALLEENKDLYVELAFGEKQYKELMECNKQYRNVLETISEKKVDIEYLSKCNDIKEYNAHWCDERFYLTQEEFDLLKSWLDNKKDQ